MAFTRTTRSRMLITILFLLVAGGALIAWDAFRAGAIPAIVQSSAPERFEPAAIQQVLDDPNMRALIPIAPPVQPNQLGNPNPFSVLEER